MKADSDVFVVDASFGVAWAHGGQATDETSAALRALQNGAEAVAPALWPVEVANALLVLVRRGLMAKEKWNLALHSLGAISISIDHEGSSLAFARLSELAHLYGISVYDTAYLELALRRGLPLACKDGLLRNAARRAGVALWSSSLRE